MAVSPRSTFVAFDLDCEEDIKNLLQFYDDQVADGKAEGIALKPDVWSKDVVPMLKIRNFEYLRLVYGYNYTKNLERHTREKDVRRKMAVSIREQELNLHLLAAFTKGDVNEQAEIYKLLIVEFSKEEGLDPRL